MVIIAKGQLQHHFWGNYVATIALIFASRELAEKAAPHLVPFHLPDNANAPGLVFHGGGAELKAAEATLKAHGANMKKVGSLAKSIDYGEPFTIEVELAPAGPKAEQLAFEL
jgi:hypothetical protein